MSKETIFIKGCYLFNEPAEDYSLEFGKTYLMFGSQLNLQEQMLSVYKNRISFINSPFKDSIKVPLYFKSNLKQMALLENQINNLNLISFDLDYHSLIGTLLLVIMSELNKKDIVVVETTGLINDSIFKLLIFNLKILDYSPDKLIIVVDFNFVISSKFWIYKVEKQKPFEDILYDIPLNIRKMTQYPFRLQ